VKFVLRPAAVEDIEAAAQWYEEQRVGLGQEFLDSVAERVANIRANPEAYAIIMENVRRALLRRFPYG
jgi:hypothetical protein